MAKGQTNKTEMTEGQEFTGSSLEQALNSGEFESSGVELVGMVKPASDEGLIKFSRAGCESWVDIPTSLIKRAKHIGQQACKDHRHPIFRITLKQPEGSEAQALAALLTSSTGPRGRPSTLPMQGRGGLGSGYQGMITQARASRGWGPIVLGPIIIGPEGDECIYVDNTADHIFCMFCPGLSSCWGY